MSLNLKFWGVRGSIPSSYTPAEWSQHFDSLIRGFLATGYNDVQHIQKYFNSIGLSRSGGFGTATTCVEVQTPQTRLIIDGGTGIRTLSEKIMSGTHGNLKGPFHIFMTHFHWDHVIGLPFFAPHFIPGVQIHYYAVHPDLEQNIRSVFRKPFFPVVFENLPSKIHFHVVEPRKPFMINDLSVTPYLLDHPDPCWGLKAQWKNKAYAHCVDTEGTRVSREDLGPDLPLYQNIDVMYYDAQYTFPELVEKSNWGHSASQIGLDIAIRENIKRVLFTHHDPGATIQQIHELKRQTQEYMDNRVEMAKENEEILPNVEWEFAHEGMEIKL
ncbi:MAG: MBL fold metallo-hydrolase [Bdellovibrionota bacterium]